MAGVVHVNGWRGCICRLIAKITTLRTRCKPGAFSLTELSKDRP